MTDLPPTVFVLFGATGDLSRRMVLPAFFELAQRGLLPQDWRLVGNGRGDVSHVDFADLVHDALTEFGPHPDQGPWEEFAARLRFAGGGFEESDPGSLLDVLGEARGELGGDPQLVHSVLDEDQVFRIDHFLGKEGTQDLHVLRFANDLFQHAWHRDHVAQVQVDVPEDLDVAQRAAFYDATGAALDMLVTHLFQVAAEVAMEPPASLSPDDLQEARESVLAAFRPLDPDEVVLGQFDGYTDIEGVADDSRTDTYVAARLWVDTDRWHGVPFVLRTGKRMAASEQRVSLLLRRPDGPVTDVPGHGNVLSLSLSGSGAVDLQVVAKEPGPDLSLATATATLQLADVPGGTPLPPYVSLLHDVLVGDRSLFTSSDGLAHAWRAFAPLQQHPPQVHRYAPGSWGPEEAEALAEPCGWLLGDGRG